MVVWLTIFVCARAGLHVCLWLYMLVPSVLDIHTSGLLLAAVEAKRSSASITTPALFSNWAGRYPSLCFCFQLGTTPPVLWTMNQKWPRGDKLICQGAHTAHAAAANNNEALGEKRRWREEPFLHSSKSSHFESLIRSLLFPTFPPGEGEV